MRLAWLAWITICVVWGTTFLGIRIALETIPPFLVGGLRFLAAGIVLAMFVAIKGRPLPGPSGWTPLAITGFCLFVIGNGGVVLGLRAVPTGLAAVLIGMSPFWMAGLEAALSDGKQLHARQWTGLAVGFAGILYLVWPNVSMDGVGGTRFALGVLATQVGCAGWSAGSAYTRRHVLPGDVLSSAAVQMIFGGAFMCLIGGLMGEWSAVSFNATTIWAMVYLLIAGSLIGFGAFSYALQHLDVAVVSLYTYVNPIIALALGTMVLGEPFSGRIVIAAAVIVAGILLVGPAARPSPNRADGPLPE